jgi:hypothetical protein
MTGFDHANFNELLQHFSPLFIHSHLMLLQDATFSNYWDATIHEDTFLQYVTNCVCDFEMHPILLLLLKYYVGVIRISILSSRWFFECGSVYRAVRFGVQSTPLRTYYSCPPPHMGRAGRDHSEGCDYVILPVVLFYL